MLNCAILTKDSFPAPFLCYNTDMKFRGRRGQTMVEYVLIFTALLVVIGSLTYLLGATKRAVVRTERLVGSDYP